MRFSALLALALTFTAAATRPSLAIVGGDNAGADLRPHVVMLSSDRGSFCSATVIAADLLLTAGHCVGKGANYRLLIFSGGKPVLTELGGFAIHPGYSAEAYSKRKLIIDLALVRLKAPLSGYAALPLAAEAGVSGQAYRIAGFGLSARGAGPTGGVLREATLVGVEPVSKIQLRLKSANGSAAGSCQGDSGGPVLRDGALVGILASAVGQGQKLGCGGATGVALIGTALPWIRQTAAALGARLP